MCFVKRICMLIYNNIPTLPIVVQFRYLTDKQLEGFDKNSIAIKRWMAQRYKGQRRILCDIVTTWKCALSSRGFCGRHMETLGFVATSTAGVNENILGITLDNQLYKRKDFISTEDCASSKFGIFICSGQHSSKMQQAEYAEHKTNEVLKYLALDLIVAEDNEESHNMIRMLGQLANVASSATLPTKFAPSTLAMRNHIEAEMAKYNSDMSNPNKKLREALKKLRKTWAQGFKGDKKLKVSHAVWSTIATQPKPVWDLIQKLLTGDVELSKGKKFVIPTSHHNLNQMGKVDQDLLVKWLNLCVSGRMSLPHFRKNCVRFKATKNVQARIVDELKLLKSRSDKETPVVETWEAVQEHYKYLASEDFCDKFIHFLINQGLTKPLAPVFKLTILKNFEAGLSDLQVILFYLT